MVRYETYICTLTGDSDSETLNDGKPIFGKLYCVEINNHATNTPSANWDIEIYQGTAGGNDDKSMFLDATVSNSKVVAVVYYPRVLANKDTDGDQSTVYDIMHWAGGVVKVTGANMGASKTAVVKVTFEVA